MGSWIVLFRGINVGGHHQLPMAQLRSQLESLGLSNVQTYIQSGNMVFESTRGSAASLAKQIEELVEKQYGFRPPVFMLKPAELQAAIAANPFAAAIAQPKSLHFYFLSKPPRAVNTTALESVKSPTENFHFTDHVFYLHTPAGFGLSKLAANVDKYLGVSTTARNYRTVERLMAMSLPNHP